METTDTQTRDIILRLKRVKAARGLSCGRICAMVAEAGGSVSLSTVKRVFADGSEDWSFRVCDTVQPIADVLLAEGGAPELRWPRATPWPIPRRRSSPRSASDALHLRSAPRTFRRIKNPGSSRIFLIFFRFSS